jgi:hypothetical protein
MLTMIVSGWIGSLGRMRRKASVAVRACALPSRTYLCDSEQLKTVLFRVEWVGTKQAYSVSTVLAAFVDVQFSGHETCTWYSQVPLVTFQYATFGSTVGGN